AQILEPQRAKWIDPLWNNLRPIILPIATFLWTRTRDWIWDPLTTGVERMAPAQVAQWRSISETKRRSILTWSAVAAILLIIILPGSHQSLDDQVVNDPDMIHLTSDPTDPDNPIWVLDVLPVQVMPFSETLRVSGKVDFDEQRVARIGATVTGRVTEIVAMPGQEVDQGTVLGRINSTELGQAQLAFLKARAANELAARAFDRAKILYKEDVIAKADLQRRQSEAETTAAERRAM
ncbi:MAG: efflux RND transporter periplasmic adaptor subunit, partial [Fluviibacter sp.]